MKSFKSDAKKSGQVKLRGMMKGNNVADAATKYATLGNNTQAIDKQKVPTRRHGGKIDCKKSGGRLDRKKRNMGGPSVHYGAARPPAKINPKTARPAPMPTPPMGAGEKVPVRRADGGKVNGKKASNVTINIIPPQPEPAPMPLPPIEKAAPPPPMPAPPPGPMAGGEMPGGLPGGIPPAPGMLPGMKSGGRAGFVKGGRVKQEVGSGGGLGRIAKIAVQKKSHRPGQSV